jgi:hypothetical protein
MTTKNLNLPEFADGQDNPDIPINIGLNVFDAKVCEMLVIDIGADADLNITATGSAPQQWQHAGFEITDGGSQMGAARDVILPNLELGFYALFNNNGGAYVLTLIGPTGTGISVADGARALLYCDGTNVVRITPDT